MFAPNEIVWRFDDEDEQDNRYCIRPNHLMPMYLANRVGTITSIVEDWADNEMGQWETGDLLKVIVVWPEQLVGTYHCSMAKRASAFVYDKTREDAVEAANRLEARAR